jgi:hypothetical protein
MERILAIALAFTGLGLTYGSSADKPTTTNQPSPVPLIKVETNSVPESDEKRLLALIPELKWTKTYMIQNGWLQPGQVQPPDYDVFSKKNFRFLGSYGQIVFIFRGEKLSSMSFFLQGDKDFTKLYRMMEKTLRAPEQRSGNANRGSRIDWNFTGSTNEYCVSLVRYNFEPEIERSLQIIITRGKAIPP